MTLRNYFSVFPNFCEMQPSLFDCAFVRTPRVPAAMAKDVGGGAERLRSALPTTMLWRRPRLTSSIARIVAWPAHELHSFAE